MERKIAPVPLAGQGHSQQKGGFVQQKQDGHAHQNFPPGLRRRPAVPQHHADDEQSGYRKLGQVYPPEQGIALMICAPFRFDQIVGLPEVIHLVHRLSALIIARFIGQEKRDFQKNQRIWVQSGEKCDIL